MVRGRDAQRIGQLHRPPPRGPRRADGDHLGERRSRSQPPHQLPRTACRGVEVGQCPEVAGRGQGRPGDPLPADDPRGRLRDAGLRAHRRDPFDRLRRLLGRRAALAGSTNRAPSSSSPPTRRRAAARRTPLKTNGNQALEGLARGAAAGGAADRRRCRMAAGPRPLAARGWQRWCLGRLPARADGRRGPAVHPLHLRLDRKAQGRACTPPAAISSTPR